MNTKWSLFILLFYLGITTGCSFLDEELKHPVTDVLSLNTENIDTKLKVIHLKVDQKEFDNMYSNFYEDIEINAVLDVYKNKNLLIENENVEIEIKGVTSVGYSLKSIGLKFENTYNNTSGNLIAANALPWHSLQKIKAFRLRNSGSDVSESMIKDMSLTQLAIQAELDLDLTYAEQVVVFVNDVFYGLMNLRTEANTNGIAKKYQVDKDRITLAKIVAQGKVEHKDGDEQRIHQFFTAIANEDFGYLYEAVDMNNFMDYMIFESYIGNEDWPKNNVRLYAIDEGPFRFILYDLDFVHTIGIKAPWKDFIDANFYPSDANPIGALFNVFYAHEDFKSKFDKRYNELLDANLLSSERFDEIVKDNSNRIMSLMPVQIQKHQLPETLFEWNLQVDQLRENFRIREKYLDNFME